MLKQIRTLNDAGGAFHDTRIACLFTLLLLLLPLCGALAQDAVDDPVFRDVAARLEKGETEQVRAELPDLIKRYQNHPGLLYVQAKLASDGIEAAKLYQSILDNYPRSEWADDGLFHLQQYYYAMGLYKTAELKMQQLKKEYPDSEYLAGPKTPPPAVDSGSGAPAEPVGADAGDTAKPAGDVTVDQGDTVKPAEPVTAEPVPAEPVPADPRDTLRHSEPAPSGIPAKSYALQTGAFSTADNAFTQKTFFEQRGYSVEVTNRVRGGRSLYLVWVGSYPSRAEAREASNEIMSRFNITPLIVER